MQSQTDTSLAQDTTFPGQPSVEVQGFSCIESLAHTSREAGWDIEYRQLEAGTLVSEVRTRQVGKASLILESTNRRMEVAAATPIDAYTLLVPFSDCDMKINEYFINRNQALVLSPGSELYCVGPATSTLLSIHIDREEFETTANSLLPEEKIFPRVNIQKLLPGENLDQLRTLATQALANNTEPSGDEFYGKRIVIAGIQLIRASIPTLIKGSDSKQLRRQRILAKLIKFIEINIRNTITLEQLCEMGCMSQSSLQRLFLSQVGMAPYSYLQARRLELVRQHLLRGDSVNSIAEIAASALASSG